jgi:hypothetical protein
MHPLVPMKPSRRLLTLLLVPFGGAACASTPPPSAAAPAATSVTTTSSAELAKDADDRADLVVDRPQIDVPDYHARAVRDAERVFAAMESDLLACYVKRVAVNPRAHGYITVDVVIGPQGTVQAVETTGGAVLGERTMRCIVQRIERASFEPPHGGGTLRVHVPFALRRVVPGEAP